MSLDTKMKESFSGIHKATTALICVMVAWGALIPYLSTDGAGFPTYILTIAWGPLCLFLIVWFIRQLCRLSYLSGRLDEMEDQYNQSHLWVHEQ